MTKNKEIEHAVKDRFEKCLSSIRECNQELDQILKPGSISILLKHIEENILRPLSAPETMPEFTYAWDLKSYPRKRIQDTKTGYSQWAADYGIEFELEEKILAPLLGNLSNKVILDFGCGTGRHSLKFAKTGAKVTGIDITPEMLAKAEKKAAEARLEIAFKAGDILKMELPQQHYDIIFSSLTVTHISDLSELFKHLFKTLKSDGRIIISDIHPCFKQLGSTVGFVQGNHFIELDHNIHSISDYFMAASESSLVVHDVVEFPRNTVIPYNLILSLGRK